MMMCYIKQEYAPLWCGAQETLTQVKSNRCWVVLLLPCCSALCSAASALYKMSPLTQVSSGLLLNLTSDIPKGTGEQEKKTRIHTETNSQFPSSRRRRYAVSLSILLSLLTPTVNGCQSAYGGIRSWLVGVHIICASSFLWLAGMGALIGEGREENVVSVNLHRCANPAYILPVLRVPCG